MGIDEQARTKDLVESLSTDIQVVSRRALQSTVRRCANCIHFGELRGIRGTTVNQVCLAPVTTEPPPDGTTAAKNRFVHVTSAGGECELHTLQDPFGVKT